MNLVAKEYVAARVNGGGVLLLSEFTGAAKELKTALMVNPYDTDGVKEALRTALDMPPAEARRRMRSLRRHVLINDVDKWARRYLTALEGQPDQLTDAAGRLPDDVVAAMHDVASTTRLLVAVDFDGTLAPIVDDPASARPIPRSMEALHQLASVTGTEVCVISGRARALLPELLDDDVSDLHLVGSHGAEGVGDTDPSAEGTMDLSPTARKRLAELLRSLQQIAAEHRGVALEIKPTGVAVHLRGATERASAAVAAEVEDGPATWPGVHLLRGKQVLELTVISTDKGRAVDALRKQYHATAVLYVGDDITDENAFAALRPGDLGIKVGGGATSAAVRVADPGAVADLLTVLTSIRQRVSRRLAATAADVSSGDE
jgi:trehalose 6-phosphate synthase/phosphatase